MRTVESKAPRCGKSSFVLGLLALVQVASATPMMPKISSKTFHVIAKKDDVHEISLDGHTCQLTYRAANSAHGEQWKMEISREGNMYKCVIEDMDRAPPHASFYGWSAHMFGAKDNVLDLVEVWTHEEILLEEDGYLVEGITIRSDSHWNLNGLGKILIQSA